MKRVISILSHIIMHPLSILQYLKPRKIPVIIINFNQLFYLKQLLDFLIERKFENIVIIDNGSSYKPLLEYYETINNRVIIERRTDNLGHLVFFKDTKRYKKYRRGFYILTDPDIVPNPLLPDNFVRKMIRKMMKHFLIANKVGFALDIKDIPDYYPQKENVLRWEVQYWSKEIEENVFVADTDTTFAIYRPGYKLKKDSNFLAAIRLGGNFTAKHGGWYLDIDNLSEENKFYMNSVNKSATWSLNADGTPKYS